MQCCKKIRSQGDVKHSQFFVMTQKEMAKQYSFLNGKQVKVYVGRVPCKHKHIEKEFSLYEKENCFGKYEPIIIEIQKTHFNGKMLTIIPKCMSYIGALKDFKIKENDITNLQMLNCV